MFRLTLLVTFIISFLYFWFPSSFDFIKKTPDVLGIKQINQAVNAETVRKAVLIHCINKGELPNNLNDLYNDELSKNYYLDLEKHYYLKNLGNCEFEIKAR